jgi:hypothetical protein
MTPQILDVVSKEMELFKRKHWSSEEQDYKKIDVKEMLNHIFSKVVSSILFNDENIFIDGVPLPTAISNYVNLSLRANFNLGNLLTYDLL